ncbi:MAG TPA: hypothetical protein VFS72_03725 [Agromyces sp.]|nr:hypothetical protein [Agromyces sp.]
MASLRVHTDRIEVHLTTAEKTLAFRADDIVVQREDIRSATITDDPWIWIRGIRRRGTEVPLVVAAGVWKTHGGSDFVLVKGKRQAVVLELSAGEFARLVLSTNHAVELIDKLKVGVPIGHHVADDVFAEEETSGD